MDDDLKTLAASIRFDLIQLSYEIGTPHLGCALSCVDILTALYWHTLRIDAEHADDQNRDRFILSKGHATLAQYVCLARKGFFPPSWLNDYAETGSPLEEHPTAGCVPGIEVASGSLGHGLSYAIGLALGGRLNGLGYHSFVLMGDGECNEGSVWEAAMFAPKHELGNLVAIVDANGWQGTGRTREIVSLQPLTQKWHAFGWNAVEVNGHNIDELIAAFSNLPADQPTAVIANTVKGKGVSFMEDDNNWHYRIPTADEVEHAREELGI